MNTHVDHDGPNDQDDLDNHANQLNPDHDEYWHSRDPDCEDREEYEEKYGESLDDDD